MKGRIKEYNPDIEAGVILGRDQNLYHFSGYDWWDQAHPTPNQDVEFVEENDKALAIVSLNTAVTPSKATVQ